MNRCARHSARKQTRRSVSVYIGRVLVLLWLIGAGGASTGLSAQSVPKENSNNSVAPDVDGGATSEVTGVGRNVSKLAWIMLLSMVLAWSLWQQRKFRKELETVKRELKDVKAALKENSKDQANGFKSLRHDYKFILAVIGILVAVGLVGQAC